MSALYAAGADGVVAGLACYIYVAVFSVCLQLLCDFVKLHLKPHGIEWRKEEKEAGGTK